MGGLCRWSEPNRIHNDSSGEAYCIIPPITTCRGFQLNETTHMVREGWGFQTHLPNPDNHQQRGGSR